MLRVQWLLVLQVKLHGGVLKNVDQGIGPTVKFGEESAMKTSIKLSLCFNGHCLKRKVL